MRFVSSAISRQYYLEIAVDWIIHMLWVYTSDEVTKGNVAGVHKQEESYCYTFLLPEVQWRKRGGDVVHLPGGEGSRIARFGATEITEQNRNGKHSKGT
jgi:hypothetical protein